MRILFPVKFTQSYLDDIINEYWSLSFDKEISEIVFDLSIVEWINTEEIAFLFAWIRNIYKENKKVEIWLPYSHNIYESGIYQNLEDLKKVKAMLGPDNDEKIKRRSNRNIFLLAVWGMLDCIGISPDCFKNIIAGFNAKRDGVVGLFGHLVIPFTVIASEKPKSYLTNTFSDVMAGNMTRNQKKTIGPFDLGPAIINSLQFFHCYSPFESRIISNVITKELFANSLIHSNIFKKNVGKEECYFSLALNNKWEPQKAQGKRFVEQFMTEKDKDALDFYKDKEGIINDIKKKTSNLLLQGADLEEADLSEYVDNFKNQSYLEFTFLDFGDGISSTLLKKFDEFCSIGENKKQFKTEARETQILEYAFFSESSRDQYHARLEQPELFPRGLYFLVDMVRRYKGLLTVRSGKGKVIYDFSDKIFLKNAKGKVSAFIGHTITVKDAIRPKFIQSADFAGTMVSIVLPEKKKEDLSYEPVRADNSSLYQDIYLSKVDNSRQPSVYFKPDTYEYISMLVLYERVITTIRPEELAKVKGFDSYIYIELLNELKLRSGKKCVIFIDFEFYPRTDNIQQLLFYLTNSPYVNEYSKAVIINLVDEKQVQDEVLSKKVYSVLSEFKVNLFAKDNEPHIFRPIPCINFEIGGEGHAKVRDLSWIGVKEANDELQLNQLFLGHEDQIRIGRFLHNESLAGSVFADNNDSKYAIFKTDNDLFRSFVKARHTAICKFINDLITDGAKAARDHIKKDEKQYFIFQASKGNYQTRYLSLYETLHSKYISKYLAKRLLDNYMANVNVASVGKFNKIITVTVSSQLIGVAIRDLIIEDPAYVSLKLGTGNTLEDSPSLIMLSSYYSFEDEKPFKRIDKEDTVLVVNDVIATGSLVLKLVGSIRKKGAVVMGVASIADCRLEKKYGDREDDSEIASLKDDPMFTLVGYPSAEIEIRKFKTKTFAIERLSEIIGKELGADDVDVKRINPLLNTVVELSDEYAEKQRILFDEPGKFLPEEQNALKKYQEYFFKIGHFEQNISHNAYLTNMRALFSNIEGERIMLEIKKKMDGEYQNRLDNRDVDDLTKLFTITSLARQMENRTTGLAIISDIEAKLAVLNVAPTDNVQIYDYKPDFIFYPIFSGIENFSHKKFHEIFGTEYENIIGLQRFDTDKGWRFPFPPKRFNNITRNKHILIIDSGALTGESLIQMIDSLSFLDVAKIDVITIIGRIEDFNREFFSRMRSLKVKTLHGSHDELTIEAYNKMSFSNLNIFFGINFHIPVFSSRSSCPFCEELVELESYTEKKLEEDFPQPCRFYIEKRIREIRRIDISSESNPLPPSYIPKRINGDGVHEYDIVSLFFMRDKLGKIDSYRFYKEYYKPFDDDIIRHLDKNIFDGSADHIEVLRQI